MLRKLAGILAAAVGELGSPPWGVLLLLLAAPVCYGIAGAKAATPQDDFLASEAARRVAHMDSAFRNLSITVNAPDIFQPDTVFDTNVIQGESITLDENGAFSIRYRMCNLGTGVLTSGARATINASECKEAGDWKAVEQTQPLAAIHANTIQVKKVEAGGEAAWFHVVFNKDMDNTDYGDIYCADEKQCREMATDLRALYAIASPLPSAPGNIGLILTRLNAFVGELVFHQKRTAQGKSYEVARVVEGIGMSDDRQQLRLQDRVCAVPAGQACDQSAGWLTRRSVVALAHVTPEAAIDQDFWLSEDGTIGAVVLNCEGEKVCMGQKASNDSDPHGIRSLEIPCALNGGCAEMKAEIEQLISLVRAGSP